MHNQFQDYIPNKTNDKAQAYPQANYGQMTPKTQLKHEFEQDPDYHPQLQTAEPKYSSQQEPLNDWQAIRQKIDAEYQAKLKTVNDEAIQKLQSYEREYTETVEKLKFLQQSEAKKTRADSYARDSEMKKRTDSFTA